MINVDLNTWVLFIVALMNALTLYYTRQTEKNTNSLVTKLVDKTAAASDAAGAERARKEGELTAALKAAQPASTTQSAPSKQPLPVADDQMAAIGDRIAAATEKSAEATKDSAKSAGRVADAAEVRSKKPRE